MNSGSVCFVLIAIIAATWADAAVSGNISTTVVATDENKLRSCSGASHWFSISVDFGSPQVVSSFPCSDGCVMHVNADTYDGSKIQVYTLDSMNYYYFQQSPPFFSVPDLTSGNATSCFVSPSITLDPGPWYIVIRCTVPAGGNCFARYNNYVTELTGSISTEATCRQTMSCSECSKLDSCGWCNATTLILGGYIYSNIPQCTAYGGSWNDGSSYPLNTYCGATYIGISDNCGADPSLIPTPTPSPPSSPTSSSPSSLAQSSSSAAGVSTPSSPSAKLPVGTIAGGVLGGLAVIAGFGILVIFMRRHRAKLAPIASKTAVEDIPLPSTHQLSPSPYNDGYVQYQSALPPSHPPGQIPQEHRDAPARQIPVPQPPIMYSQQPPKQQQLPPAIPQAQATTFDALAAAILAAADHVQ